MNWIDVLIIFLLFVNILKGYSLGLILSLFNFIQVIISLFITRSYYLNTYIFIKNSDILYTGFGRLVYFFFRLIFYRKEKYNPGFLEGFISTDIIDVVLLGFSILLIYKISTIIIDILFSLFSFLLNIRIFKKIDRYGGMLFGLFKAFLMLFIVAGVLGPILEKMPGLMLSDAFFNSSLMRIIMDRIYILEEGLFYEKTRHIFGNTLGIYRSFISTI